MKRQLFFCSFASRGFKLKQYLQALTLRVCQRTHIELWSPKRLLESGFDDEIPWFDASLQGYGYWSWKPYIILKTLEKMNDGDFLLYSDSGRPPGRIFHHQIGVFEQWLEDNQQDFMPGVNISYYCGDLSRWCKPLVARAVSINEKLLEHCQLVQASFMFMKKTDFSLSLVREWFDLCSREELVSSTTEEEFGEMKKKPDFVTHLHDQTIMSLLAAKYGLKCLFEEKGIARFDNRTSHNEHAPRFDDKNPDVFLELLNANKVKSVMLRFLCVAQKILFFYERANNKFRKMVGLKKNPSFYS